MHASRLSALGLGLAALAGTAQAYDLPSVNLGSTSFYDGSPLPGGPGDYVVEYLIYGKASRFNDQRGDKLPLPRQEIETFAPVTQYIHLGQPLANGWMPGATVILPWLAHAEVDDGLDNNVLSSREGLGDMVLGAFLQSPLTTRADGSPLFAQRIEAEVILPTGAYDRDKSVNPGSNFWSFNPYYAATYWFTPRWSVSGRFWYLWNAKNRDPSAAFGDVSSTQAGQALHANFATQYALNDKLSVGLSGYWLKQISDTEVDGRDVSGRREQVWAIGPGLTYAFSRENILTANSYFEQDAENRTEGNKFVLSFVHKLF